MRKGPEGWWLSAEERSEFRSGLAEIARLQEVINVANEQGEQAGIRRTYEGRFYQHSHLGKELQARIDEAESELEKYEEMISSMRSLPTDRWNELNESLKNQLRCYGFIMGWIAGAVAWYRPHADLWNEGEALLTFVPCVGVGSLLGGALAICLIWNPARRYAPRPISWIDEDNLDSPTFDLRMRRPMVAKFAVPFWLMVMAMAAAINSLEDPPAPARPTSPEDLLPANQPGFALAPGILRFEELSPPQVYGLDQADVEKLILAIYAANGAEFADPAAQAWADRQGWYHKVNGRTVDDCERLLTKEDRYNRKLLVKRWNDLRESEGFPRIPFEESPLAGRAATPNISLPAKPAQAAVKIQPANPRPSIEPRPVEPRQPTPPEVPQSSILFEATEVAQWDLSRVQREIDTIFARYNVVFADPSNEAWAGQQAGYRAGTGRGLHWAETHFTREDRQNLELLVARLEQLKPKVLKAEPVVERLDPNLVAMWEIWKVQRELDMLFFRHGAEFDDPEVQEWADRQPGYHRVPGMTIRKVRAGFTENERFNFDLLMKRQDELFARHPRR